MFVFLFQDVFLCYDLGVLQWKFREQQLSVHWSTETVLLFLTCGRITAQPWNDDTLKCKTTGEISAPNSGSFIFGGLSLPLLSIQPVCSLKISWLWLLKETTKRVFGLFVCLTPTTIYLVCPFLEEPKPRFYLPTANIPTIPSSPWKLMPQMLF